MQRYECCTRRCTHTIAIPSLRPSILLSSSSTSSTSSSSLDERTCACSFVHSLARWRRCDAYVYVFYTRVNDSVECIVPRTRHYMRAYIHIQNARDECEVARAAQCAYAYMHSRHIKYVNARTSSDSGSAANIPLLRDGSIVFLSWTGLRCTCEKPESQRRTGQLSLHCVSYAYLFYMRFICVALEHDY